MTMIPCKQCIINMMCIDPCNELVEYLKIKIPSKFENWEFFYTVLAESVRTGESVLIDNDTSWKHGPKSIGKNVINRPSVKKVILQ